MYAEHMAIEPIEIGVSTMIESMSYDAEERKLYVQFPGRPGQEKPAPYIYENCPIEIVDQLAAELDVPGGSIGKLFNTLVKTKATKVNGNLFTL